MTEIEYLLTSLMEECAETAQAISKIIRFGPNDRYPDGASITTLEKLQQEMADIIGVAEMLEERGVRVRGLDLKWLEAIQAKKQKVLKYMEYARRRGTLSMPGESAKARLLTAAADFVHNIKSCNVAGGGEMHMRSDASYQELEAAVHEALFPD